MQFTSVLLALAPAAVLAATEAFPSGCSAMILTYSHMLQASCENSAGVHSTSSLDLAEHVGATDGELVLMQDGNYTTSCPSCYLTNTAGSVLLECDCGKSETSFNLTANVMVDNGALTMED